MGLTRESIVKAAFAVLAKEGLEGLNLRLVATRLDVQAPALYWHVHNKAELFGLMAASIMGVAERAEAREPGWSAKLLVYGQTLRKSMLKHRDSARLCALAEPIDAPEVTARRLSEPLVAGGLDAKRAVSCQAAVIAYTLGWVVYEQNTAMHDYLAQMFDFEESFEAGLRAMLAGFAGSTTPPSSGMLRRKRPQQG